MLDNPPRASRNGQRVSPSKRHPLQDLGDAVAKRRQPATQESEYLIATPPVENKAGKYKQPATPQTSSGETQAIQFAPEQIPVASQPAPAAPPKIVVSVPQAPAPTVQDVLNATSEVVIVDIESALEVKAPAETKSEPRPAPVPRRSTPRAHKNELPARNNNEVRNTETATPKAEIARTEPVIPKTEPVIPKSEPVIAKTEPVIPTVTEPAFPPSALDELAGIAAARLGPFTLPPEAAEAPAPAPIPQYRSQPQPVEEIQVAPPPPREKPVVAGPLPSLAPSPSPVAQTVIPQPQPPAVSNPAPAPIQAQQAPVSNPPAAPKPTASVAETPQKPAPVQKPAESQKTIESQNPIDSQGTVAGKPLMPKHHQKRSSSQRPLPVADAAPRPHAHHAPRHRDRELIAKGFLFGVGFWLAFAGFQTVILGIVLLGVYGGAHSNSAPVSNPAAVTDLPQSR